MEDAVAEEAPTSESPLPTTGTSSESGESTLAICLACEQQCKEARSLWLSGTKDEDFVQIEACYQQVWDRLEDLKELHNSPQGDSHDWEDVLQRVHRLAGEKLSLLFLQAGRSNEADVILSKLGYTCRLASHIFNYKPTMMTQQQAPSPFCRIVDHFLTPQEQLAFSNTFSNPQSPYWTQHHYQVEPPSPYFSFLLPLQNYNNQPTTTTTTTLLQALMERIRDWAITNDYKAKDLAQATSCEIWAHNRPHATGHQLHFDSDNEGEGTTILNPVMTAIISLNTNQNDTSSSQKWSPTLITNQKLISKSVAQKGWFTFAGSTPYRMILMDGKVLHGVLPGQGRQPTTGQDHRVTVMMAFWKQIPTRDLPTPGAARPFPMQAPWAQHFIAVPQNHLQEEHPSRSLSQVHPIVLDHVFERVSTSTLESSSLPWKRHMGMPDYEHVFQGL